MALNLLSIEVNGAARFHLPKSRFYLELSGEFCQTMIVFSFIGISPLQVSTKSKDLKLWTSFILIFIALLCSFYITYMAFLLVDSFMKQRNSEVVRKLNDKLKREQTRRRAALQKKC